MLGRKWRSNLFVAWGCGHGPSSLPGEDDFPAGPVCAPGGQSILWAWARDADPLVLPSGVGFEVGQEVERGQQIVMQVCQHSYDSAKENWMQFKGLKGLYLALIYSTVRTVNVGFPLFYLVFFNNTSSFMRRCTTRRACHILTAAEWDFISPPGKWPGKQVSW